MRRILLASLIVALLLPAAALARPKAAAPQQSMRFGIRVTPGEWSATVEALRKHPAAPDNPLWVFLSIPKEWAAAPDWASLDDTTRAIGTAHANLGICTQLPGAPGTQGVLSYLASLSEHAAGHAKILGLSMTKSQFSKILQGNPNKLALALKEMTVALRGGSHATILIGEVKTEDLPLMTPLYARHFRAYVEGYSSVATDPTGAPSEKVVRYLESYHLGAPLLLHLPKTKSPIGADLLVLLAASRNATFTDIGPVNVEAVWTALLNLRACLSPQMAPGYVTQATSIKDKNGPRPDIGIINLLDGTTMVQGMVLVPRTTGSKAAELSIHLPTADVANPVAYPLPFGDKIELGYTANRKKHETILKVPWKGKALVVLFSRLKTGTVGESRVLVSTTFRIPVAVILARHQALQKPQEIFLNNYKRAAIVSYHFKLAGSGGSLDVTFKNTFLFEKGTGARWVQNELLINGVKWRGKKLPQLPIIEVSKVNTLPLALTLGRDYKYRYVKESRIGDHDCYVIAFTPLANAKGSFYSGRVWIDKNTYAKIRMTVKQSGLEAPLVSNEETDTYAPFHSGEGRTFWLLFKVKGQQILSIGGRNVIAERGIVFGKPVLNEKSFQEDVTRAEASDKPILQETPKGLRYLEKQKNGTRKLMMESKTSRLAAAGGFYYDKSLDFPLPIVGVNYFNYNWRKTGTQINLLVGGAVNTLTVAKVNLLPKFDGSLNAALFAIPFENRFYLHGKEDKSRRVKVLREYAACGLGWRFNQLSKLSLNLGATYYGFSRAKETAGVFRLPKDHTDVSAGLSYDFSWRGWSADASYKGHKRTDWKPWGVPGRHLDVNRFKEYGLWNASFSKSFYLPYFQDITAKVVWMDGRNLDRFSRYGFTYLGVHSLAGFTGSGVRFDRGVIASLVYQFNLANIIRFGLTAQHARVQPRRENDLWQNHTGLKLNAGVTGPWNTYWTLDFGYALKSDLKPVEHDYTAALLVIKLW